ncbi:MAG: hypothetical protein OXC26_17220 [Albidovulum sp.]|nr:hypothetical protein [Albidovulum sp.]
MGGKKNSHWCEVENCRAQGSGVAQTKVTRPTGTNDIQTENARREALCLAIRTISNRFQERNEAHIFVSFIAFFLTRKDIARAPPPKCSARSGWST